MINLDLKRILATISYETGLTSNQILDMSSRQPGQVASRWALWSALRFLGQSYMDISRSTGHAHNSIMHGCDRYLNDPKILSELVAPLARGVPFKLSIRRAYDAATASGQFVGWSIYPDWIPRPISGYIKGGTIVSDGIEHPAAMVFQTEAAAKAEAYLKATRILSALGISL